MSTARGRLASHGGGKRIVGTAVAVGLLASCGGRRSIGDPVAGRQVILDQTANRTAHEIQVGDGPLVRALDEVLPNVVFRTKDDGHESTWTDVVAVGRIVDIAKGVGFVAIENDECFDGCPSDFDDPEARWWTIHVTFKVNDVIGTSADDKSDELVMAVTIFNPDDYENVAAALRDLDDVVAFLWNGGRRGLDPSIYKVLSNEMIATVGEHGRLGLPFVPAERAEIYGTLPTLQQLKERGETARTIELEGSFGHPRRE